MGSKKPKSPAKSSGSHTDAQTGQPVRPVELEQESSTPKAAGAPRAVPIGRPMTEEEYRQMKEHAARDEPSAGGADCAQEDA